MRKLEVNATAITIKVDEEALMEGSLDALTSRTRIVRDKGHEEK